MAQEGPLTKKVVEYSETIRKLVPSARTAEDFALLEPLVAVDEFERVGTMLEVQNWRQAKEMMAGWASGIDRFETTVHRVSEVENLVYWEIEERHYVGDTTVVVNSLTVFAFNAEGKICHLDVFLQKAPGSTTRGQARVDRGRRAV